MQTTMMRAAVTQFQVGTHVATNLATCLRILDLAAKEKPHIIVLPEFCNHASWYDDQAHCRRVSVDLEGDFLNAIAQKACDIGAHVVINVSLNRSASITTGTSLMFGPCGKILAASDKQVLIGHENDFLTKADCLGPLLQTDFGPIGMYACMDGVILETPRGLALRGARILTNSLNSFASDEARLHIPVRAAENKVFVLASNKIGPLVPQELVDDIAKATGIPVRFLNGAGESQIVAPDGTVLAVAPPDGEAVVFAQFNPRDADDKCRPDGTHIFQARRPALYQPIVTDPTHQLPPPVSAPDQVQAALIHTNSVTQALTLIQQAFQEGAKIVAIAPMEGLSEADIMPLCPTDGYAALRQANGDSILVASTGVVLRQCPLHKTGRFGDARADYIATLQTPFGTIGLLAGDDSIFPETGRLIAIAGVQIVIAPVTPLEDWELATGLLERAAENRLNILVPASGPKLGFAAALQADFTVLTPWSSRAFDGLLSHPIVTRATSQITHVMLFPGCSANKLVSRNTDLLADRPWALAGAIVAV